MQLAPAAAGDTAPLLGGAGGPKPTAKGKWGAALAQAKQEAKAANPSLRKKPDQSKWAAVTVKSILSAKDMIKKKVRCAQSQSLGRS